ncbi:glycosyltransferase family 2 protein [Lactococcus carnosus]|uniref:glycosyltransferase family 2 protein n=1 Tax=Pseudolactococcus carnosus TaxID=2749961 RepID=UPI001FB9EE5F|nr:glycosyltransferase family 2 protein [Lactococcus carnosus]MCJ1973622.1 glycosyltransferase family 2 protein [Lactococcus carnosus]MCJ1982266.1 glycosyltransferase family 2 protein [Lactococcus carnosus]
MDKKKILLIIPAYNESEGIAAVIKTVDAYRESSQYNLDYIVINDGSSDNEEEILLENKINHVELVLNLGIGGAVQTGYIYAKKHGYDIAIQFDGDGQHDIASLPQLVDPILNGEVDFTVGSRFIQEGTSDFKSTGARQLGIKILSQLIKWSSKVKIKDVTSGYRAGNHKVIDQFANYYPSKYPEPESYMHLFANHIKVREVGVKMFERTTGESSINLRKAVGYMIDVSLSILIAGLIKKENQK